MRIASELGFVRFPLGPGPEDAIVCDVVEGLIEGQDASAHVVDIFPFPPMLPLSCSPLQGVSARICFPTVWQRSAGRVCRWTK